MVLTIFVLLAFCFQSYNSAEEQAKRSDEEEYIRASNEMTTNWTSKKHEMSGIFGGVLVALLASAAGADASTLQSKIRWYMPSLNFLSDLLEKIPSSIIPAVIGAIVYYTRWEPSWMIREMMRLPYWAAGMLGFKEETITRVLSVGVGANASFKSHIQRDVVAISFLAIGVEVVAFALSAFYETLRPYFDAMWLAIPYSYYLRDAIFALAHPYPEVLVVSFSLITAIYIIFTYGLKSSRFTF